MKYLIDIQTSVLTHCLWNRAGGESIDWTIELSLCERCADKSSSNYHAWCHRQWVLQKAPSLLKYESRLTEKFIRKHIGDYSGYNHRQHVLLKLVETGFQEEHEAISLDDYRSLCEYVDQVTQLRVESIEELVAVVISDATRCNASDQNRLHTLLYCLNIAAYDLQLCDELTSMFGFREAFNCHRRAMLKFIVDYSSYYEPTDVSLTSNPLNTKGTVCKSTSKPSRLVDGMQTDQMKRGGLEQKWCALFLGFKL